MVKLYPSSCLNIWNELTKGVWFSKSDGMISTKDHTRISESLASYHGFLSYEFINDSCVYYLEFETENYKTLFLLKYGV